MDLTEPAVVAIDDAGRQECHHFWKQPDWQSSRPSATMCRMMDESASVSAAQPANEERDLRHLRWLAIAHYGVAVVTACFAWYGYRLLSDGLDIVQHAERPLPAAYATLDRPQPGVNPDDYRATVGVALVLAGAITLALSIVHAGALALVGRWIARRKRRTLCIVFSFFDLMYALPPLGLILSAFALLVLFRPSVAQLFQRSQP